MNIGRKGLEDMNMTSEEIKSFSQALKNESFRKLFFEYAQELNQPANLSKRRNQQQVVAKDGEHSVNNELMKSEPVYALKVKNGVETCYINVARCEKIDRPKSSIERQGGAKGLRWDIPHKCNPPRKHVDRDGTQCTVYDVIFHPDTLRMAETNGRFSKMVEDMACNDIEKYFNAKIDRSSLKKLDDTYFGLTSETSKRKDLHDTNGHADSTSVTNTSHLNGSVNAREGAKIVNGCNDVPVKNGHDLPGKHSSNDNNALSRSETTVAEVSRDAQNGQMEVEDEQFTTPRYIVKYLHDADLAEDSALPASPTLSSAPSTNRPSAIEVRIELPSVTSASQIDVDVFERRLELRSELPVKYKLNLRFSYEVVADDASARFEKKTHTLTVCIPVRKQSAAKPHIEELVSVVHSDAECECEPITDDELRKADDDDCCFVSSQDELQSTATDSEASSNAATCNSNARSVSCSSLSNSFGSSSNTPLHSILKVHSLPDGCSLSNDDDDSEVSTTRRRRVSKSVSFSETNQVETPDYRKPVATAFRKLPPNALTRREKRAMQKRNRQPSGSDSNGETSSCERSAALQSTKQDDEKSAGSSESLPTGERQEPANKAETQESAEPAAAAEETMEAEVNTANEKPHAQETGEAKKKRKRNKRKKHVSGDNAAPKNPSLQMENEN